MGSNTGESLMITDKYTIQFYFTDVYKHIVKFVKTILFWMLDVETLYS